MWPSRSLVFPGRILAKNSNNAIKFSPEYWYYRNRIIIKRSRSTCTRSTMVHVPPVLLVVLNLPVVHVVDLEIYLLACMIFKKIFHMFRGYISPTPRTLTHISSCRHNLMRSFLAQAPSALPTSTCTSCRSTPNGSRYRDQGGDA